MNSMSRRFSRITQIRSNRLVEGTPQRFYLLFLICDIRENLRLILLSAVRLVRDRKRIVTERLIQLRFLHTVLGKESTLRHFESLREVEGH